MGKLNKLVCHCSTPKDLKPPFITIMMPVRNEANYVSSSLKAVLSQDYPRECTEVIVVDGMSTDQTREIVKKYMLSHPNVQLLDNTVKIAPTALNIALRKARGDVIIRVDGHCEIAPDYVSRCVQHLFTEQVDCVGGPIETIGENFSARTIAMAMSSFFGVGGSPFRTIKEKSLLVDSVAFPAYTREAVKKTGFFDEELVRNQDDEYNYRLRKLGGKILLSPDIRSRYYSRSSLIKLWQQYFQYGYWKVRVMQKHPYQMHPRQLVPPIFVAGLMTGSCIGLIYHPAWILSVIILAAYLMANLAASAWLASRNGCRYLFLLPYVFMILHVSYGLGFLVGLVKFANGWRNWKFSGEIFQ